MPTYDIYTLAESNITVSGGEQLDGVTQGDGSHLVGETITLNNNSWVPISITDNDDDFEDNGGSGQNLTNETTIDGETFSAGTRVEAEYSFTVTDGTNNYTIIAFNVNNGSPSYATVEALAFIGPVAGFPPIGVPLTVTAAQEGPVFDNVDYATPPCFAKGTRILTPLGEQRVETLRPGDLVETLGNGAQPLRWVGSCTYPAIERFAPIRFAPGVLGNPEPLLVSPQHRVLVSGWRPDLLFGEEAVLAPAHAFVGAAGVTRREGGFVTYFHLMFDEHELIWSEGALTESLFTADALALFGPGDGGPELAALLAERDVDQTALRALKTHELHAMMAL
ncbi:MAG: Hint domain-containing protein [Litoreibacter sp.]|nr:Hint domain-containing protein [Litoreibacter sp.]